MKTSTPLNKYFYVFGYKNKLLKALMHIFYISHIVLDVRFLISCDDCTALRKFRICASDFWSSQKEEKRPKVSDLDGRLALFLSGAIIQKCISKT